MLSLFFIYVACIVQTAYGRCYFPVEYQGIFSSQIGYNNEGLFEYAEITILPDAIPVWGVCHLREESAIILSDSSSGQNCFRCFHLYLRSPNVIQVFTDSLDRCYRTEAAAITSCPSLRSIQTRRATEIVLYKSRSFKEDGRISRVMCPFVGRYHFSYGSYKGRMRTETCVDLASQVSSCPKASQLKFYFRDCTFGNLDRRLQCLGSWTGFDGHRYLALLDPDVVGESRPKYRCAIFLEETNGAISLSLSSDSSCQRELISPWLGFETLSLFPVRPPAPPAAVYSSSCVFPSWVQGKWQDIKVSGDRFVYRNEEKDLSHSAHCISAAAQEDAFTIYTLTQCGKESFSCVWFKKRSDNIMEFIMGPFKERFNASDLCSKDVFWSRSWITQSREEEEGISVPVHSRCPLMGEFRGQLPDDENLCAQLTSDCDQPNRMKYTIYPCRNETLYLDVESVPSNNSTAKISKQKPKRALRTDLNKLPQFPIFDIENNNGEMFTIISSHSLVLPGGATGEDKLIYVLEELPVEGLEVPREIPTGAGKTEFPSGEAQRLLEGGGRNPNSLPVGKERERYYECLGKWEESGISFTYTWRKDTGKYECFAGVQVSPEEVYIVEAGTHCRRGLEPLVNGMKLNKKDTCKKWLSNDLFHFDESFNSIEGRSDRFDRETLPWRTAGYQSRRFAAPGGASSPKQHLLLTILAILTTTRINLI